MDSTAYFGIFRLAFPASTFLFDPIVVCFKSIIVIVIKKLDRFLEIFIKIESYWYFISRTRYLVVI